MGRVAVKIKYTVIQYCMYLYIHPYVIPVIEDPRSVCSPGTGFVSYMCLQPGLRFTYAYMYFTYIYLC